jgi:hypothetical protein
MLKHNESLNEIITIIKQYLSASNYLIVPVWYELLESFLMSIYSMQAMSIIDKRILNIKNDLNDYIHHTEYNATSVMDKNFP